METSKQGRVLGAARTLSQAVTGAQRTEETKQLVARVASVGNDVFSLVDLEKAMCYFTNHNSNYTNVQEHEFHTLVEEVLNNAIRSVLVYDEFSNCFGDAEVYSLSMAFQYNLSVEALTLSGINVSDEAVSMLCESLVRSRVNYIDFSNTPLEDEAGRSLAALAHVNPYLRTVIVDDTLIPEEVLDEIDVACQFNQSNFEGSGGCVDESLMKEGDLGRLKHRLKQIVRAKTKRVHFCVAHLFGCCPNGDLCLYSHAPGGGVEDVAGSLSAKITELFAVGGRWEERLPSRPQEGASWRNPDEAGSARPTLNLQRRQAERARAVKAAEERGGAAARRRRWSLALGCAVAVVVGASLWRRRR